MQPSEVCSQVIDLKGAELCGAVCNPQSTDLSQELNACKVLVPQLHQQRLALVQRVQGEEKPVH